MKTGQLALTLLPSSGEVVAVKYGETGYYQSTYGKQSQEWVDMFNLNLGLTPTEAEAMVVCSMTGKWENYEKMARFLQKS